MAEKTYKIKAPIGTNVLPKELMTERELRTFAPQLIQDTEQLAVWKEKMASDEIELLVEWLVQAGYKIEEQK